MCFGAVDSPKAEGAGGLSPKYRWEELCNQQWLQPLTKKYAVLQGQAGGMHTTLPKDRRVTCMPWEWEELGKTLKVLQSLLFLQLHCSPLCSPMSQRKGCSSELIQQRDLAHTKPTSSCSKWEAIHREIWNR